MVKFAEQVNLTEHEEAELLAEYLDQLQATEKITLFSHIPNETFTRNWGTRMRNKREGVRKGVPDYIIITDTKCLFLELKRRKGSNITQEQVQWNMHLQGKQTSAYIAKGFDEAVKYITDNL